MEDANIKLTYKITLTGDSGTGKSNIMTRYCKNAFSAESKSTIGVEFMTKTMLIGGQYIKLQIWDTAGQERYRTITAAYFRNSYVTLIVYDITNYESFLNAKTIWYNQLTDTCDHIPIIILVGNKLDLEQLRTVPKHEAEEFAKQHSIFFEEVSALSGTNVEKLFTLISTQLYEVHIKNTLAKPQDKDIYTIPSQTITTSLRPSEQPATMQKKKKYFCF
jgi:Ras-related protein Rab-11A